MGWEDLWREWGGVGTRIGMYNEKRQFVSFLKNEHKFFTNPVFLFVLETIILWGFVLLSTHAEASSY